MRSRLYTPVAVILYAIMGIVLSLSVYGQDGLDTTASTEPIVFYFQLNEAIMPAAGRKVKLAYEQAEEAGANYIIMELNTFGGRVDVADEIRKVILDAEATTAVFINNNAASAGALISIAHDSIYMVKGASIGAATVVSGEDGQQMPDKYQSYMRSTMRSTAEAKGRDPKIAEAMVDDRVVIPGIIDSAYTLTFTTDEAIQYDYCEGYASSLEDVLDNLGVEEHTRIEYEESTMEDVINFLMNPVVSSILMMMIFFGIFFELQTPGVGFPLIAAITGAVLYFAPLYLEGLASYWEIIVFIVGAILLMVEIFAIPGFGIAGISGIILMVGGLILSLIGNVNFDFSFAPDTQILWAVIRVALTMTVLIVLFLVFNERIAKSKAFSRLVLSDSLSEEAGYTSSVATLNTLIGAVGLAITDLRPSGKIEIGEERYEASTEGELIEKGTRVKVIRSRGNYLQVRETKDETA